MCKQVIKYQSSDGQLFNTELECISHQRYYDLVNLLEENIYSLRNIDADNVLDLLVKHKELFLEYLQNS